jgi:translation initiation factor IF-3
MVKEVQLSPRIDPHDLGVKTMHAIDFLCEDMKVKVALKFRGREMAHTEFGFQVINKFIEGIAAYGHPDFQPKLIGRNITVMISPLPRNKRAKNPRQVENADEAPPHQNNQPKHVAKGEPKPKPHASEPKADGFANNPFDKLEIK